MSVCSENFSSAPSFERRIALTSSGPSSNRQKGEHMTDAMSVMLKNSDIMSIVFAGCFCSFCLKNGRAQKHELLSMASPTPVGDSSPPVNCNRKKNHTTQSIIMRMSKGGYAQGGAY
jgi:hypothetical protein